MPSMNGKSGKQYWRSLNELADKPSFREFVEREFPSRASEWLDDVMGGSRRTFLKIMGASMALAGLASCRRWPAENLAPYAHRPAGRMDGVPVHYATAYETAGIGVGVLAVSVDGRPIKVDGNPSHPLTKGASDAYLQASILNVYDPDRSRSVVSRKGGDRVEKSWREFTESANLPANGAGVVILTEASRSPSVAAMRKKLPQAQWFEYEPMGNDNQRAGAQMAFGRPLRAVPDLSKAEIIVSIDADLFHGDPLSIKYNRDFAAGRQLKEAPKPGQVMNKLFVVESAFTITGSMADHRRGAKPSQIPAVVAAIGAKLGFGSAAVTLDKELTEFVDAIGKEIQPTQPGKAVLVAGARQSPEVHAAVATMNALLAAPVTYYADAEDPRSDQGWTPSAQQLVSFAQAAKTAAAVLVLGANPVLTAPADLDIAGILRSAKLSIHAGTHEDETAQACQWHLPMAHYLEAWGDVRSFDGTVSITQPLIEPIFGAKSIIEILALLAGSEQPGMEIVRDTAKADYLAGRFTEWAWKQSLFNGVVENTARIPTAVTRSTAAEPDIFHKLQSTKAAQFELALCTGAAHDGRYANNGWLMELPDPMTRVTWDNPAILSIATAANLKLDADDVVTLTANGKSIEATVYILPGQPDSVISIAAGYGRKGIGSIAEGTGVDPYPLFSSKDGPFTSVTLAKTGKVNHLACVQDHHTIDQVGQKRLSKLVPELVVEGTFTEYLENPALDAHKVLSLSLFNEFSYENESGKPYLHKWGMAIDLTTCTGCSACVIACQAENNIPIVGKEMVYRGREMHWLRIDRYFKHDPNNPQAVHQPLLCMHCENAPCEEVCPVAATTHSVEGLNMMTYNRCIGTRYCSNNCPYKVRRFNFFDYNSGTKENLYTPNLIRDDINELHKMQKNPQVTVRSRGVMEKCTYCVQRIENARIEVRAANRGNADNARIPDGKVVTACQQACPTEAIVFGDLNDTNSRVAKLHKLAQSYGLLDPDLNTKPRTVYLAKVRNPAEGLDEALYEDKSNEGPESSVTFGVQRQHE